MGVADIDGYAVYMGIQAGVLYPTNEADNAIFYPAVAGDLDRESVYNALMRDDDLTLLFQVSDTYQFDPAVHGCTADHGCRWTYNGYGGYCTQD